MTRRLTWINPGEPIPPTANALTQDDGANGLLLTPDVDLLFDRGFISFEAQGTVLVSPRLAAGDLARLGLRGLAARGVRPFAGRQTAYLEWRRRWVFLS